MIKVCFTYVHCSPFKLHSKVCQTLIPVISCHSVWCVVTFDAKLTNRLYIPILVIKENHIPKINTSLSIQTLKVSSLVRVRYLYQIFIIKTPYHQSPTISLTDMPMMAHPYEMILPLVLVYLSSFG